MDIMASFVIAYSQKQVEEPNMTPLENLFIYYNQLSESSTSKAVLRRCLENINRVGEVNIYELADLCYTSPATISRLVKALGYKSYSVFQTSIAEHCTHYDFHNRFCAEQITGTRSPEELVLDATAYNMAAFKKRVTPETYMPIVDALHQAKSVTIFAYGLRFMENTLQSDLIMSGIVCDIICDDKNQVERCKSLTAGDLALFIFPDAVESASTLRSSTRIAKENGATVVVLSSAVRPLFQHVSDYTLSFQGRHYMCDSFYLEMLLVVLSIAYRKKFLDSHSESRE